jgi:hypothetical protein
MHVVAAVRAEWSVARARLWRTRLGPWLALLAAGFAALAIHPWGLTASAAAIQAAMLGAVLAVAFTAGSDLDRATLSLTLTHPTSPGLLTAGRWIAATALAALTGAVSAVAVAVVRHTPAAAGPAAVCAAVAGGAAAAAALAVALGAGNAPVAGLFLYMGLLGWLEPSHLSPDLPAPLRTGLVTLAAALPAPWRYERLARGDAGAWAHAAAWISGGVLLARCAVARRGRP